MHLQLKRIHIETMWRLSQYPGTGILSWVDLSEEIECILCMWEEKQIYLIKRATVIDCISVNVSPLLLSLSLQDVRLSQVTVWSQEILVKMVYTISEFYKMSSGSAIVLSNCAKTVLDSGFSSSLGL